jgi:hypothetical protein
MPKQWPGTQSDTYQNTSNMKPIPAPCDGRHFADNPYTFDSPENYDTPKFGQFNQETVNSEFHSESATAGEGQFGNRQYASNRTDLQSTGYGSNYGLNEIPYGTGSAFDTAQSAWVDNSRADRGKDS